METTEPTTADAIAAADALYAAALSTVATRPELLSALERCATRHARGASDMGDVTAATLSLAVDMFTAHVAAVGMPATDDDAAALLDTICRNAARRAREEQRGQWAPRIREARPTEAPNRMERWSNAALVTRAERYTAGDLERCAPTTAGEREARRVVLALMRLTGHRAPFTVGPRERAQAVIDGHAVYAWPMVTRAAMLTTESTVPNGERATEETRVSGSLCAPRHSGQTTVSAESTYWHERRAVLTREAMDYALGADVVDRVADGYTAERVRRIGGRGKRVGDLIRARRVSWARTAGSGRDRGTVRRETMRAAGRVAAVMSGYDRTEARRMVDRARVTAPTAADATVSGPEWFAVPSAGFRPMFGPPRP